MIANAAFNVFILFRYPQYEDAQRNHAEAEIKDFLNANPAFSQRIFQGGVEAGTSFFQSNPGNSIKSFRQFCVILSFAYFISELARQGVSAMFASATAAPATQPSPDSRGAYASV